MKSLIHSIDETFHLNSCFQFFAILQIIVTQHIVDHACFGNKISTAYVEMLDLVCAYKFSSGRISDPAEHITEFR